MGAYKLPDENAVGHHVEGGNSHAGHTGQGTAEEEPQR